MDTEIEQVKQEIRKVQQQIDDVGGQLTKVQHKSDDVEEQLKKADTEADVAYWRQEKEQLRTEKEQLRTEKEQLRTEKEQLRKSEEQLRTEKLRRLKPDTPEGGSPSKRPCLEAPDYWQCFVQSARQHYREWEDVEKDCDFKFLKLSADPLLNFSGGLLLWVRECYKDLKEILDKALESKRFIVLGTSGIGKSYFSVFWICYLATKKEKVVWNVKDSFYLLDFSDGTSSTENAKAAKAYGPFLKEDRELREVFQNPSAWFIIDGAQERDVDCTCHVLLACSSKKSNYHEFAKSQLVTTLYMPVWEEEEICEFLDAFEKHRDNYSHMKVPVKEKAMENLEVLGGVPRYVLCSEHTEERKRELLAAVDELGKNTCFEFLCEEFHKAVKRDAVVHIKCGQSAGEKHGKYSRKILTLASNHVRLELRARFHTLSEVTVVSFLRKSASSSDYGSYYGYVFELVAHALMKRGGEFRMKRVREDGPPEEVAPLKLSKMKFATFVSWEDFPRFEAGTYYQPKRGNLRSIDALLHPNLLLQYFSYNQGVHGYLVQGLEDVHAKLQLPQYKVCSCVPKDKYDKTGWQQWNNTGGTRFKGPLPQVIHRSEQYVIEVDYEKYGSQSASL